jgi:hypothetical protein
MNTHAKEPQRFEFYYPRLDTAVEVENAPGGVIIRASRDTFTEARKECPIRELAAEGFIPDDCRWSGLARPGGTGGVRWVVDASWLMPGPEAQARCRRFILRLMAASTFLWLALMGILILC